MKNKISSILLIVIILLYLSGCNFNKNNFEFNELDKDKNNLSSENKEDNKGENKEESENNEIMLIVINDKEYEIKLEKNETVKALINLLPLDINMSELNGNEKYYYLDEILPISSVVPKRIEKGDVMLYGNNCIVIFYESFNTSYSYTKIGHIDNLPDLGNGSIKVILKSN